MLNCSEIFPDRLWVGGYVREEDVPQLRRLGISCVISLQADDDLEYYRISQEALDRAYRDAGIEWRRMPTTDFNREALSRNLPEAVIQVEEAFADPEARVYLHCTAGVNRAPTTAAGYLIKCQGYSAQAAYGFLASRRDCSPTLDILEQYENLCRRHNP